MAEKEYVEREAAEELLSQPITMSMCLTREECLAKRSQRDIDVAILHSIPAADVRSVVTCSDCKWWTKQEASLQGRCELLQMYPAGAWFCANGKREES